MLQTEDTFDYIKTENFRIVAIHLTASWITYILFELSQLPEQIKFIIVAQSYHRSATLELDFRIVR